MQKYILLIILSSIILFFSSCNPDYPDGVPDDPFSNDITLVGILYYDTVYFATIDGALAENNKLYYLDVGNHYFSWTSNFGIYNSTSYIGLDDSIIIFFNDSITIQ